MLIYYDSLSLCFALFCDLLSFSSSAVFIFLGLAPLGCRISPLVDGVSFLSSTPAHPVCHPYDQLTIHLALTSATFTPFPSSPYSNCFPSTPYTLFFYFTLFSVFRPSLCTTFLHTLFTVFSSLLCTFLHRHLFIAFVHPGRLSCITLFTIFRRLYSLPFLFIYLQPFAPPF